jgi:hypothetical protein
MNKSLAIFLTSFCFVELIHANELQELQTKLIFIAAQEAEIANIGANKTMMLYGTDNPIPIINRWNQIEQRPALTAEQITQINSLEAQKQRILQQVRN